MKGTTKSLGQKDKLDKFYTKSSIAQACLNELDLNSYDFILEPSAGDGSFSRLIPNCYAIDIAPGAEDIVQQDFFLYKPTVEGRILVVGNPPFGQQSTLALKFFNHAASFATTIAFILPRSFKKVSLQNQLDLNFSLIKEMDLPEDSFTLDEEDYGVPCVFQVWERTEKPREKVKMKTTTTLFEFTKNPDDADFRIQRVGGNAGKAYADKNGAVSSNYYLINKTSLSVEQLIEILNTIEYPSITFTVGPKSLSKGELILEVENVLIDK